MIRYLSGKGTTGLEAVAWEYDIGLMIQPGNTYWGRVHAYPSWCADNGCFTTNAAGFPFWRYLRMIQRPELQQYRARCRFVTAPDELTVLPSGAVVGNAVATLARFSMWSAILRNLGFPVALVAQDGLEDLLDRVPWDTVDVLFLGGSTEWKLGHGAKRCVDEARLRGKRTHMGRVNSLKRLRIANSWGIDTADGTYLKHAPDIGLPRLLSWLRTLAKESR